MKVHKVSANLTIQKYKMEIRRKHRQRIRINIMNQFSNTQSLYYSLSQLSTMIDCLIHSLASYNQWKIQRYSSQYDQHSKIFRCRANSSMPLINRREYHEKVSDAQVIFRLVEQIDYLINNLQTDAIQKMLEVHNSQSNRLGYTRHLAQNSSQSNQLSPIENSQMYLFLRYLIRIQIPFIISLIDDYESNYAQNWSKSLNLNFSQINIGRLERNCVKILCHLSSIPYLSDSYSFPHLEEADFRAYAHPYQKDLHNLYYQNGSFQILTRPILHFLEPYELFYSSMVSIGNILHQEIMLRQQKKYAIKYYQILRDINLQDILAALFADIDLFQKEQDVSHSIQQRNEKEKIEEQTLLWFLHIYTKFLFTNNLPIYSNHLLISQLEPYIYRKFRGLKIQVQMEGPFQTDSNEVKFLKYLTSLVDYCQIKLDNILIVNTVIPLLRRSWNLPSAAKLWLFLTFKGDYEITQLLNLQQFQDKRTVKKRSWSESDIQSQQIDIQEASLSKINKSSLPLFYPILLEILYVIAQNSSGIILSRRDKDYLQGIYNIILDVDTEQALQIWRYVFLQNCMAEKLSQISHISSILSKIEDYIGSICQ